MVNAGAADSSLAHNAAQLNVHKAALEAIKQQLEQAQEQVQSTTAAAAEGQKVVRQQQQELAALTTAHEALHKVYLSILKLLLQPQQRRVCVQAVCDHSSYALSQCGPLIMT